MRESGERCALVTEEAGFLGPLPPDDPRQRRPDISLAKSVLFWQPRVALHDGLSATIAYFSELLDLPDVPLPLARKRDAASVTGAVRRARCA